MAVTLRRPPAKEFVEALEAKMEELGVGKVGVVSGRYYAMDRDKNWDRGGESLQCADKG